MYVPNAFSPNNNELNEVFKPVARQVHDYHVYIYNRWGELVFETVNPEEGWNGTSGGQKCLQDVYVYRLLYTDNDDEEEHEVYGKVLLIR